MSKLLRHPALLPALVLAASCAAAAPARAVTTAPSISTFDFAGPCGDCQGTASAELKLSNYNLGDVISANNFLSFFYTGTDLLPTFTVTAADAPFLSGTINPPLPGPEDFSVIADSGNFDSQSNGDWCAGSACFADYGLTHTWTLVQATTPSTPVSEPATFALLAGALFAAAALRRRA